jgi:hypothetical protein
MKIATIASTAIFACALMACDKDTKPQGEPAAPASGVTSAATATAAAPAPATTARSGDTLVDTDLSTPADFESEAEGSITSKNYKAALTSLENEIAKD